MIEVYIGIDVGTTSVKFIILDHGGKIVFKNSQELSISSSKNFIAWRLAGKICTKSSDVAGPSLFSISENKWDEDVLKIFPDSGIRPLKVVPLQAVVGAMVGDVARKVGFQFRPSIVTCGTDNACASLDMNAFTKNVMVISIGTSETVILTNRQYISDLTGRLHTFRHIVKNVFYHMRVVLSTTFSFDWLSRLIDNHDIGVLIEKLKDTKHYQNVVFFLSYLNGKRTPHRNPGRCGVIFGFSGSSDKKALARSCLGRCSFCT